MKIVTVLGSPRKRGTTAAVLSAFEALVCDRHAADGGRVDRWPASRMAQS